MPIYNGGSDKPLFHPENIEGTPEYEARMKGGRQENVWERVELPVDGWTWEQARHMFSDININIPKHGRGLKLVYEIPMNPPESAQPAFLRKVQD